MAFSRRALSLSGVGVVLVGAILVACSDGGDLLGPKPPEEQPKPREQVTLECTLSTTERTFSCSGPSPEGSGGASRSVSVGREDLDADLIGSNIQIDQTNLIAKVDVRAVNLLPQAMGTTDGSTLHPNGVRTFFTAFGANSGTVEAKNAVLGTFINGSNVPYYQYNEILAPGDTSGVVTWELDYSQAGADLTFELKFETEVPHPNGWVDVGVDSIGTFSDSVTIEAGDSARIEYLVRMDHLGELHGNQAVQVTSSADSIVTASTTVVGGKHFLVLKGKSQGIATVVVSHVGSPLIHPDTIHVLVNSTPLFNNVSFDAIGNATLNLSAATLKAQIQDGDSGDPRQITSITPRGGGTVTYDAGTDTYRYLNAADAHLASEILDVVVSDGYETATGQITINTGGPVWYVRAGGAAGGTGRDTDPFSTLTAAVAKAEAADSIFVMGASADATSEPAAVTLDANQVVIGHGHSGAAITRTLNGNTVTLLATDGATHPQIGGTLNLSAGATVRGIHVNAATGSAVVGSGVSATLSDVKLTTAAGAALNLADGTITAQLDGVSASNPAGSGVVLKSVNGTITAANASITGGTGAAFLVDGGGVTVTWNGGITQGANAALVNVVGGHSGTLTFDNGTLSATAGTGLQFNAANGFYNFNGITALSGTAAGVGIAASSGEFSFDSTTTITNPSGTALSVTGGAPAVVFNGAISTNASRPVVVDGVTADSVVVAGNITSTGQGILVQNNGAAAKVAFLGASKSLSTGANPGVSILTDASHVVFGGGGLSITTSGARGFHVQDAGIIEVRGDDNTISTTGSSPAVFVVNASSGVSGMTFRSVSSSGAANAIVLNSLNGTGFQITGTDNPGTGGTLSATNTAVVISAAASTSVTRLRLVTVNAPTGFNASSFGTLRLDSASVTSTAGTGIGAATGQLQVTDVAVSSTGGAALNANGVALSGSFTSLSSTTTAGNALSLTNATGNFTASSGNLTVSGAGGTAVVVNGNTAVGFTYSGSVNQGSNAALLDVSGGHTGTLTFNTGAVAAGNGTGLQFNDADGVYNFNGTLNLSGGDAGIDLASASGGDVNVIPAGGHVASILNPTGVAVNVAGGAGDLLFNGGIRQDNAVALLNVAGGHTGTLTFQAGTVNANGGTGLQFTAANGNYNFVGSLDLSGGDAGIDIGATSSGTVNVSPAGGHSASILSPTGAAIAIAGGTSNLTFNGNVTQANNAALLSVTGGHGAGDVGVVSFPTGTLTATNGTGLQFDNADGTYNFGGTVTLSNSVGGADAGIDVLNNSDGTFTFSTNTAVTNPANQAITVQNGVSPLSFTYPGSFTKNNNSVTGILVQNNTGGTIAFTGDGTSETKLLSTGTANAVNLSANPGTTVQFQGGGLAITTTSGTGFNATGGGTVEVRGGSNTVTSGTGTAINLNGVASSGGVAGGISFQSVTASGGANGIVIQDFTSGNGFQVTGVNSTAGSGGTISNLSGANGTSSGVAVYLSNARNVSLRNMNLSGSFSNHGVYGSAVRGLRLLRMAISANSGDSQDGTLREGAISLVDVGGAVKIDSSTIRGGSYNNLRIDNSLGTSPVLDSLVVDANTFGTMQGNAGSMGNDAVGIKIGDGTADVRVRKNQMTFWWGDAFDMLVQGSASATLALTENNMANSNADRCCAATNVAIGGGNLVYNISKNILRDAVGAAIALDEAGAISSNFRGTLSENTIGVSGVANSGSAQGSAISVIHLGAGTSTHSITNNVIRQVNGSQAVLLQIGDATRGGNGTFNATVTGNNIQEEGSTANSGRHAIAVTAGTGSGDGHLMCVNLGGAGGLANAVSNFGANRIRPNQRFATTVRMPGYGGANNDNTAVANYLNGRNSGTTAVPANSVSTGGGGYVNTPGGAACPQP